MDQFLNYFQITALVLFLLLFAMKISYLRLIKKINPVTIVIGKKGIQLAMDISFIIGLIIWILEVLLHSLRLAFPVLALLHDMQLINSTLAKYIGTGLIGFGFIIYILALITLGDSWRMGIDYKAPGKLVTEGIYSISRNPISVFIDFYFLGTFLINGTFIFLVFAILAAIAVHLQILQEEKFLTRTYGLEYRDYCARTGRYMTWKISL